MLARMVPLSRRMESRLGGGLSACLCPHEEVVLRYGAAVISAVGAAISAVEEAVSALEAATVASAAGSSYAVAPCTTEGAAARFCRWQVRRVRRPGSILRKTPLAERRVVSVEDVGAVRSPHSGSWSIG